MNLRASYSQWALFSAFQKPGLLLPARDNHRAKLALAAPYIPAMPFALPETPRAKANLHPRRNNNPISSPCFRLINEYPIIRNERAC